MNTTARPQDDPAVREAVATMMWLVHAVVKRRSAGVALTPNDPSVQMLLRYLAVHRAAWDDEIAGCVSALMGRPGASPERSPLVPEASSPTTAEHA